MARSRSHSRSRSRSASALSRSASPVSAQRSLSPVKTTGISPFMIRVFVTKGKHTPLSEFDQGNFPMRDEFQVYGWKETTPSDIIRLLFPSFPPNYRAPAARFHFRHIYVDATPRGLYRSKDLTAFTGRDLFIADDNEDDPMDIGIEERDRKGRRIIEKSLDYYGFIAGDLLSVNLHVPEPRVPAPGGPGHAGFAPGGPGGPSMISRDGSSRSTRGDPRADMRGTDRSIPPHGGRPGEGSDAAKWSRGAPLPPHRTSFGRDVAGPPGARLKRGSPERDSARDRSRSPRRERFKRERD